MAPFPTYQAEKIAPGVRYLYAPRGKIIAVIESAECVKGQPDPGSYVSEAEAAQAAALFQSAPQMAAALREVLRIVESVAMKGPQARIGVRDGNAIMEAARTGLAALKDA